jgi:hypothetical protein
VFVAIVLPRGFFIVSIRTQAYFLSYLSPPPPPVSSSSPNPIERTREEAPSSLNRLFYFREHPPQRLSPGTSWHSSCFAGREGEVMRRGPYPPNSRLRTPSQDQAPPFPYLDSRERRNSK